VFGVWCLVRGVCRVLRTRVSVSGAAGMRDFIVVFLYICMNARQRSVTVSA